MLVSLVICGFGGVGRCLAQQVLDSRKHLLATLGLQINVKGLLDSSGGIQSDSSALNDEVIAAAIAHKTAGSSLKSFSLPPSVSLVGDLAALLSGIDFDGLGSAQTAFVIADCSASDSISTVLVDAVGRGAKVALANKKPLTTVQQHFAALTSGVADGDLARPRNIGIGRFESTVGAGVPVVAAIMRLLASGDVPTRVQGCFSGTLGFVMTGIQEGKAFSEVVKTARDLGYTEPDPREDLGGVDVARKALILARFMGWTLEMSDVSVEPLFTPDLASLSIEDFMQKLHTLDAKYKADVEAAAARGEVLRYVATLKDGKCVVGLKSVPASSPIGSLSGTANMAEFVSKWYSESNPLVLQGPGAGGDQTAAGVLSDIVDLAFARV